MKTSLGAIERHARLRWIGAPLLVTGLSLIGLCVADWLQGGSGYTILLGTLGTGMGLASFGANHEAVIALAARYAESEDAPRNETFGIMPEKLLLDTKMPWEKSQKPGARNFKKN